VRVLGRLMVARLACTVFINRLHDRPRARQRFLSGCAETRADHVWHMGRRVRRVTGRLAAGLLLACACACSSTAALAGGGETRLYMYANLRGDPLTIDYRPLIRPASLPLGPYGEHSSVASLKWRHWGSRIAVAHGRGERCFNMLGCDRGRVLVRLSARRRVPGCEDGGPRFFVYGRLSVTWRSNRYGRQLRAPARRTYPIPGADDGIYC